MLGPTSLMRVALTRDLMEVGRFSLKTQWVPTVVPSSADILYWLVGTELKRVYCVLTVDVF